ncbi:hypothetical protein ACLOJK_022342 [Asimina triloba]
MTLFRKKMRNNNTNCWKYPCRRKQGLWKFTKEDEEQQQNCWKYPCRRKQGLWKFTKEDEEQQHELLKISVQEQAGPLEVHLRRRGTTARIVGNIRAGASRVSGSSLKKMRNNNTNCWKYPCRR